MTPKPPPRERGRYHTVIDHLPADIKVEFDRYLAEPTTTGPAARAWLAERGVTVSRWQVYNYQTRFDRTLQKIQRSADVAAACARAAKRFGVDLPDATLTRFQQLHMQRLWDMDHAGELAGKEWLELIKAIAEAVGVKRELDRQRRRSSGRKAGTASAAARKAAKAAKAQDAGAKAPAGRPGWADTSKTAEIAERVRRVLGV